MNLIRLVLKKNLNLIKKTWRKTYVDALEGMGTTFIKLGQFLATRPDIIGEEIANDLVKTYKIKLPAFDINEAKANN